MSRIILPLPLADVWFELDFLPPAEAERLFQALSTRVAWRHEPIRLFGREVLQPRLTAWYGDAGAHYSYSTISLEPLPWLPELQMLRRRVEQTTETAFNSVLLNLYRSGQDSMGWHADDEPELGPEPVIASVSLGATRRFRFRPRPGNSVATEPFALELTSGSLLLMRGRTQQQWQHAIPKTTRAVGPRLNLTFRRIIGM